MTDYTVADTGFAIRFTEWQKRIAPRLRRHAVADPELTELRLELLRGPATSGPGLANYLRNELELEGRINAPALPNSSVADMTSRRPSIEWETRVYEALNDITPRQAQRAVDWYVWHVAWLEELRFEGRPRELFGADRVDAAREGRQLSGDDLVDLDTDIRTLLRRLGGFPQARGSYPAYDSPVAQAWWRRRLALRASRASEGTQQPLTADECHISMTGWVEFIDRVPSSYAVVLNARALAAVCRIRRDQPSIRLLDAMRAVAQRCEHQHPEFMDFERLSAPPELPAL